MASLVSDHASSRAGVVSSGSVQCRDHHRRHGRVQPQRLVPRERPEEQRASPKETAADHKRIKELERELRRKDKALAETAALLVLSKKLEAIFHKSEDE